jgi:NitT/TauT family transport system substrate-binding protein/sulfonate transport system substrate-binding protein
MNRGWIGVLAAVAGLLLTACGGAASQPAGAGTPAKFTLRYGFINPKQSTAPTGPVGWALKTGSLKRDLARIGVEDVQAVAFGNAPDLEAAMQGGSIDVGELSDTGAIVARAAGVDTRLIAVDRIGLDAWLIARKNGPTSPAELRGRLVGTLTGSFMDRYLYGVLQEDGLLGKLTETSMYLPDAFAALQRGQLDAYATPMPQAAVWADQGFPVIDRASSHSGLTGNLVSVAAASFLATHPGFTAAWDAALRDGVVDLKRHADQYYAFEAADQGYPVAAIREATPLSQYSEDAFPAAGMAELPHVVQFLVNAKLARTSVDIAAWRSRA